MTSGRKVGMISHHYMLTKFTMPEIKSSKTEVQQQFEMFQESLAKLLKSPTSPKWVGALDTIFEYIESVQQQPLKAEWAKELQVIANKWMMPQLLILFTQERSRYYELKRQWESIAQLKDDPTAEQQGRDLVNRLCEFAETLAVEIKNLALWWSESDCYSMKVEKTEKFDAILKEINYRIVDQIWDMWVSTINKVKWIVEHVESEGWKLINTEGVKTFDITRYLSRWFRDIRVVESPKWWTNQEAMLLVFNK